ncbi:MAG: hypothetical protein QOG30_3551, partial [Acidimicrobiaceae bacterium]
MNSNHDREALEAAVWAAAEGRALTDQLELIDADSVGSSRVVDQLLAETQTRLESVHGLTGPERAQVIADFAQELEGLRLVYDRLHGDDEISATVVDVIDEPGVVLQASWSDDEVVVWAAGRTGRPETNEELADRLERLGGPALGWRVHRGVTLPNGVLAEAVSIPIADALGWLVAIGGGLDGDGVGASVRWVGHIAIAAVRQVAQGAVVPTLQTTKRGDRSIDLAVRWQAALVGNATLDRFAATMPAPVRVMTPLSVTSRAVVADLFGAVVHAVVAQAAAMVELPAPPPTVRTSADVAESVTTRLDGSTFTAPPAAGSDVANRLHRWARPVMSTTRPQLFVQLDPPDRGGAWFLSVLGPGPSRALVDVEVALSASKSTQPVADELARLERLLPELQRPGALRRGQVYLSTDEAWELMTRTGEVLQAAGFEVRVPALSRRKPKPALRMFVEPAADTVVGARQLSDVRWSALFDDVELTADDVARLAAEARPLVQSRGRWVELDRVDLKEAAAALAEQASTTRLTGAEILRHAVGLEGSPLGERLFVEGTGWAADLFDKAAAVSPDVATPDGFVGKLRTYQSEALGWLGFLDAVELGGCLALDMGLGKTPTVLAHLARTVGEGPVLVLAPTAVVGNWEAEAAKFTPALRVVVHHGATRASATELA